MHARGPQLCMRFLVFHVKTEGGSVHGFLGPKSVSKRPLLLLLLKKLVVSQI